MGELETRLMLLEDRVAIEDALLAYYTAVDSLGDLDGLVDCFTLDAICDLRDLGLQKLEGHDAIRDFFRGVFEDMTHHAHHVTNFRIARIDGDEAEGRGYVIGRAIGRSGLKVFVHCHYDVRFARTKAGWKISFFDEGSLMPLGDEVSDLHAREGVG